MMLCVLCNKEFKSIIGLGTHIGTSHKNDLSLSEYYIKYINLNSTGICSCGNKLKFKNLSDGFSKHCSIKCAMNSSEVKDKMKNSMFEKYGVPHNSYRKETVESRKKTLLKNYGVDSPLKNKELKEKCKSTCIKKYGVDNYSKTEKSKNEYKDACLKKYGVDNVFKIEKVKNDIVDMNRDRFLNNLFSKNRLNDMYIPMFEREDFKGVFDKITKKAIQYKFKCQKCNNIFLDHLDNGRVPRCYNCFKRASVSKYELELYDFISSVLKDTMILCSDRSLIPPLEIDILIPSHNIAIEFNGIYWHSEINGNKDSLYHLNKTKLCNEKGIQLIHVFEDEWVEKQDIVKSIILSKLGIVNTKVFARKCEIKEIKNKEAKEFLYNNHLQGEVNSKLCLGLYYDNQLVSLLTLGKSRYNKNYEWEILRFCNKLNTSCIGGFSRLLNYFIKKYNPESLITYADVRYSDGNLYQKNNFKLINISKPNFYYLTMQDFKRYSRLSFQKYKLKDKLEFYDEELTAWENMQINNYDRIWDCGNYVFSYNK